MASDREALVEQIGDDVEAGTAEAWRIATGQRLAHRDRMIIRQALDVALAAVEAAGWGPPEPVTAAVRTVMEAAADCMDWEFDDDVQAAIKTVRAWLDATEGEVV